MSHMVIYRSAEGKPAYHQTEELADAASFVERLRNEEGVESARIFRLDEIIFDFKTVYRVRISGNDEVAARPTATPVVNQAVPAQQVSTSTPTPQPAAPVSTESVGSTSMSTSSAPAPSSSSSSSATGAMADDSVDDADSAGNGARRGLFGR